MARCREVAPVVTASPFHIDGPALISFSGGRTSAYMLRRILDDGLQPDVHVLFCNTGKEVSQTLEFVRDCERHWSIKIRWLEYRRRVLPNYESVVVERAAAAARSVSRVWDYLPAGSAKEPGFVEVDYSSASRKGQPFENLIECSGIPNAATRLCTTEMKIRIMKKFMLANGYKRWTNVVGMRADEPARVAKLRPKPKERWEYALPLADAGVVAADVLAYWAQQPFNLKLVHDPVLGTFEGNCDGCLLKSADRLIAVEQMRPRTLAWWTAQERRTGSFFRIDRTYAAVEALVPGGVRCGDDDLGDCYCHD